MKSGLDERSPGDEEDEGDGGPSSSASQGSLAIARRPEMCVWLYRLHQDVKANNHSHLRKVSLGDNLSSLTSSLSLAFAYGTNRQWTSHSTEHLGHALLNGRLSLARAPARSSSPFLPLTPSSAASALVKLDSPSRNDSALFSLSSFLFADLMHAQSAHLLFLASPSHPFTRRLIQLSS